MKKKNSRETTKVYRYNKKKDNKKTETYLFKVSKKDNEALYLPLINNSTFKVKINIKTIKNKPAPNPYLDWQT